MGQSDHDRGIIRSAAAVVAKVLSAPVVVVDVEGRMLIQGDYAGHVWDKVEIYSVARGAVDDRSSNAADMSVKSGDGFVPRRFWTCK